VSANHFDVLIVGGGLSGIAAGYHLQRDCPDKRFALLEARANIGGTWDLFRYPGVRSDSDMFTLGYSFRPWVEDKAIADGESILRYINATARDSGIDKKIRFNHRVKRASWSSEEACWSIEAEHGSDQDIVRLTCRFLFLCTGYYRYAEGYSPAFPGADRFTGPVVHPQKWPDDLPYAGKRVVVIGSGATAVTLVPAMAKSAAHVTMLQRSPTYIVSRPDEDRIANFLRRYLSSSLAFRLVRWKNILFGIYFFTLCKRRPERVKNWIVSQVQLALGPGFDTARHFTPSYNPWDQRMCFAPGGDLFEAIKEGRASVVTDEIETLTESGVQLRSGTMLPADVIVSATGLTLSPLGEIGLTIDGRPFDPAKAMAYKGMMYSGVPNLASAFGYTNASWTLKCELTCDFVGRLLNHMDKRGYRRCVPQNNDVSVVEEPWLNLSSGYIRRAADRLPRQGSKIPWRLHQNYVRDLIHLKLGSLEDGVLRFA
jgi:monooxygenase